MSVVTVEEIHDQRRGEVNQFLDRTYYRRFRVLCSQTSDDPYIVITGGPALGLPETWDIHPNDPSAYVTDIQIDATDEDGLEWLVLVTYSTAQQALNPLEQPPVPSWSVYEVTWSMMMDIYGDAILNTAFDPYTPPLTEEIVMPQLSVQRNELISPTVWNLMAGTINLDPFQGFPTAHAKYLGCSGTQQVYTDPNTNEIVIYEANTHQFKFNTLPWGFIRAVPSTGLYQLDFTGGDDGNVSQPIYVQGEKATTPQLLSETGQALPPDSTPYVQYFELLNYQLFSVFGFPQF